MPASPIESRLRRERAAASFRPVRVHTLHVVEATFGEKPTRDELPWLDALEAEGYFFIDLSPDPFDDRDVLPPLVPDLVARCQALDPDHIVVIGARVYDVAFGALLDAGLPVVDVRLPFPGSGQQRRFLDLARPLLAGYQPSAFAMRSFITSVAPPPMPRMRASR